MSRAGDVCTRIKARQRGGLASQLKENSTTGTKLQHWRAAPAIFGLEAAPVLEFH